METREAAYGAAVKCNAAGVADRTKVSAGIRMSRSADDRRCSQGEAQRS
jgi:hypothetical protein